MAFRSDIAIVAIVTIVVTFLICLFNEPQTQQNTTQTTQQEEPKIKVTYTGLCLNEYDVSVICGGIKNNSSQMLDVTIYTNVYNKQSVQIQNQVNWVRNLEPGNEAEFKGYSVPLDAYITKIVKIDTNPSL